MVVFDTAVNTCSVVANIACVASFLYLFPDADDPAHAFQGYHQAAPRQADVAGLSGKKGEKRLLFTDRPVAITGAVPVGDMHPKLPESILQFLLNQVHGSLHHP